MSQVELKMPKMGESVAEATIIKWLKNEGDVIEADEPLMEIATDKVDSDVPSTTGGTLAKQLFKEGDVVQVGAVVAMIETEGGAVEPAPAPTQETVAEVAAAKAAAPQPAPAAAGDTVVVAARSNGKFFSPLVRNIAAQENVTSVELEAISGTGAEGRVTKRDILGYIKERGTGGAPAAPAAAPAPASSPAPAPMGAVSGETEIIEMDRMRRLIADHMVMSKRTSPHVTSFVEADVTNVALWRSRMKGMFEKREGEKLTFTPIFIEAIVKAIKDFPLINVSVDGDRIIVKKDINIGMATALPSGNLIVPVIRNADRMNLLGLTKTVNDLANRARQNKLKPDEIQGGTYTITNVGTFGNVMGTPIINQPQAAIMATGAIRKKPAVIETPMGDAIAIRQMMFLSHSYDHRIIDGALGGSFVKKVADYLADFDVNRNI